MEYTIEARPTYSYLEVTLSPGERVVAEAGAMAWMSPNLSIKTSTRGGIMAGLTRTALTGEGFFQNTFEAGNESGFLGLTPAQPGDIIAHQMTGQELLLEKGAYLASHPDVKLSSNFQGLKGLFNEGMFVLRATGNGVLFFNAYGDIEKIDLDGEYIVDNGLAVAWDASLSYRITRARSLGSFMFSDRLLMRFSGRGSLWVQSRRPQGLAAWAHPFRPVQRRQRR
ncbi:MAG: TIGR00266 family protein [Chloroflexi bacterium]|nr:TIGR00266 family protein [Chloroflexota bacterium]